MRERYQTILCGALAVVGGPGETIAFVRQERGPFAGSWLLPGGGIELGENPAAAVRREVKEETGLDIDQPELFSVYEMAGVWEHGKYHILMFAFRAATEGVVGDGFNGHNVSSVRQVRVGALPLHSTDLKILTDAGVTSFQADEIDKALEADGIEMRAYRVAS